MARVLLLQPGMAGYYGRSPVRLALSRPPPLSLALLAAALEAEGHHVRVWDLDAWSPRDLPGRLAALAPDFVGISFRTPQWAEARRLGGLVGELLPEALRVAGGPHASSMPQETLARGGFDCVVRGEGEEALVALARGDRPAGVGWPHAPAPGPATQPCLDSLPLPAWHAFDLARYRRPSLVAPRAPVADLETSRGCPAGCIYCTKSVFGRGFRPRDPRRFVDEVRHGLRSGFVGFNLVDDSFTTRMDHAVGVCEAMLESGLSVPWTCTNGIRVRGVEPGFFPLARRAGCRLMAFGLESGSDQLLARIGKDSSTADGRRAVELAHRAGIVTLGYFLLGVPGETMETVAATMAFARSLPLDWVKFSLLMPLPGTPLYQEWRPHLHVDVPDDFSIHRPAAHWFSHPDLSWTALEAARHAGTLSFYGRPRWAVRQARRLLAL